jgi:hypothetical protein
MTERKTPLRLSITRRVDPGNVPVPWVPPELPASTAAPGGAVAKRDRTKSPPAPWVPGELPESNTAPAAMRDRKIAKRKPWVPPAEAPRNLPATVGGDGGGANTPELPAELQAGEHRPAEPAGQQTMQAGATVINIVNQVAAPAPFYGPWWWGWWGGCPRAYCPTRAGRTCWRVWCWL